MIDPVTGTLIAAGGQALISSAFNAWQSDKQQDFQEEMSNTAHQREVKDLRAAGLNPILSATGGHGASSPTGSSAQAASPDIAANYSKARSQPSEIALLAANTEQAHSAAALSRAQAQDINFSQAERLAQTIAQKELALSSGMLNGEQKLKVAQEIENLKVQHKILSNTQTSTAYQAERDKLKTVPYKAANSVIENYGKVRSWSEKAGKWLADKVHPIKQSKPGATGRW